MQILKSGRPHPEPKPEPTAPSHPDRIQCRRCLMIFDWLDEMPRGLHNAGKRANVCEVHICRQPFHIRTKTYEGRVFYIPFILGASCLKFPVMSSQGRDSSSSAKRPAKSRR